MNELIVSDFPKYATAYFPVDDDVVRSIVPLIYIVEIVYFAVLSTGMFR